MTLPLKTLPLLLASAFLFVLAGTAAASPESHQWILQGVDDLEAGKYSEALKKFAAASRSDPRDSEAAYFEGAALNRLRRPKPALEKLQQAAQMGYRGVGLTFDTGWALLRLGRWDEAIEQLEYSEIVVPESAKTSEFLGRAYLGLGDYANAEAKLREAVERDPRVAPTALVYLAALEQKRGNPGPARLYLEKIVRDAPQSPIALNVAKKLAPPSPPAKKGGK